MKREAEFLVNTKHFKSFQNNNCEFFPCHKDVGEEFNCLFCYCPLINIHCPGPYKLFIDKWGNEKKDCSDCTLNHKGFEKSWNFIQHQLEINSLITGNCSLTEHQAQVILKVIKRTKEKKLL